MALVVGVLVPSLLAGLAVAAAGTAPPPTPVPPHGSLSPFPSALHTPADATSRPGVSAASVALADLDTGQILFAKGPADPRASLYLADVYARLGQPGPAKAARRAAKAGVPWGLTPAEAARLAGED